MDPQVQRGDRNAEHAEPRGVGDLRDSLGSCPSPAPSKPRYPRLVGRAAGRWERLKGTRNPQTPAMAASVADHIWSCEEIVAVLDK